MSYRRKLQPVDASRYMNATPTPTLQNSPTPAVELSNVTPTPAATPVPGDFSAAFPATDTGAGALYSYQTDTVRIAINRIQENSVTYFVADVYVKNIDALKTAFAKGKYGKNIYDFPLTTANENQAVFVP